MEKDFFIVERDRNYVLLKTWPKFLLEQLWYFITLFLTFQEFGDIQTRRCFHQTLVIEEFTFYNLQTL